MHEVNLNSWINFVNALFIYLATFVGSKSHDNIKRTSEFLLCNYSVMNAFGNCLLYKYIN